MTEKTGFLFSTHLLNTSNYLYWLFFRDYCELGRFWAQALSHPGDAEESDNCPESREFIAFVDVSVLLRVPEARCAHMEPTGLLVKDHGHALNLEIFPRNFLGAAHNFLCDLV